MKAIRLLCKTRGLEFGDTIDVGDGKTQIKLEEANALIAESLAEEVKPLVDGSKKALEKELAEANAKIESLEKELTEENAETETPQEEKQKQKK